MVVIYMYHHNIISNLVMYKAYSTSGVVRTMYYVEYCLVHESPNCSLSKAKFWIEQISTTL
jgi:hypothetical protein